MSIYKKIRKGTASKISNLEAGETFLWDKWIRLPITEGRELEPFNKRLWDTGKIVMSIDSPGLDKFTFKFKKIKIYKSAQRLLDLKSKTNPVFFGFGTFQTTDINISFKQELKQYFSTIVEDTDSSLTFRIKDQRKKEYTKQLTPYTKNISISFFKSAKDEKEEITPVKEIEIKEKKTPTKQIESEFKTGKTLDINYEFTLPKVIDYLSELVPKVFNIDLLNSFEELNSKGKIYQTKMDLLDSRATLVDQKFTNLLTKPEINSKKINHDFKIKIDQKKYFAELFPWDIIDKKITLKKLIKTPEKEATFIYDSNSTNPFKFESTSTQIVKDNINKLLQPNIDLSEDDKEKLLEELFPYQKDGVMFLVENHVALLCDELGLGKKVQSIIALKYLIKRRDIKSVLIITNDYLIGDKKFNEETGSSYGWEGRLNRFAPDLSLYIIQSAGEDIDSELNGTYQIFISTYDTLIKVTDENLIRKDSLKIFDCVIFENPEVLNNYKKRVQKLAKSINPKFIWMLSNFENLEFKEKVLDDLKPKAILKRTKEKVGDQLPDTVRQEYWVEMDKEQKVEYDQALSYTQNQITEVLQTGNPYRFQSKVFLSLHQLKQVTNFSLQKIISSKGQLIVSQLKSIVNNNKQAVVFSQYDKYGMQKLIELFTEEGIKFVKFLPGMPPNELENAIKKFEKDKSITVLLAGLQATITKVHIVFAPYIIHFDQWWVPITQWQLEEKISGNGNKLPVTVISYLTKNSVDEKIRKKLFEKELLNKNLIDTFGPEVFSKLITEKEWTEIFNMPPDKNAKQDSPDTYYQNLIQLTPEKIMDKIRLLFVNLGYSGIKTKDESVKTRYSISGTFSKNWRQTDFAAQCYLIFKEPDTEAVKYYIESHKNIKGVGKIFIITLNPSYTGNDIPQTENVTIINGNTLSRYLRMLELL